MASLIDDLIDVLSEECEEYRKLTGISGKKMKVIVQQDLDTLQKITAEEQEHTGKLINLEKKREAVAKDIAMVLNQDEENLTVKDIINVLHSQKEVQERLMKVHDELKQTLKNFSMVNEINKNLIRESLEIVDFNLNYLQGMYQAPETANYSKNAVNVSPKLDYGVFDAKQ